MDSRSRRQAGGVQRPAAERRCRGRGRRGALAPSLAHAGTVLGMSFHMEGSPMV
eukprot:CAMPEP_0114611058 /NCGR_PEP_ID=MMETSP0168-20121206/3918_1 /TAXON_ID=95228 ORGANISM="Vannella sp., Strain DIVA3 517/6/12" /NCGR_SAMPLE_ID=MMETSP0168 /ASSEMBLY_ACC=CAM_ASM_000044 /LENGTH=53 /DNA_ID=CAMNT_0001822015 /DNA_START=178 /DNA_END=339 /DNA_ORIENTATION=+